MKDINKYILFFVLLVFLSSSYIFLIGKGSSPSQEISLSMLSPLSKIKSKVVAASCGFTVHGSSDEYSACQVTINCCYGGPASAWGTSQCGGACSGASPVCAKHPLYGQPCTTTPDVCGNTVTGTYDACGVCTAVNPTIADCTYSNICGQTFAGFQCPNGCQPKNNNGDINASCINYFRVNNDQVSPDGSVDFSWDVSQASSTISSKCSFVDLTSPNPRPIPGLQDLDVNTNKVRISNIQATTRFCLICAFFNGAGVNLGNTAAHQWVRIIRIGEN